MIAVEYRFQPVHLKSGSGSQAQRGSSRVAIRRQAIPTLLRSSTPRALDRFRRAVGPSPGLAIALRYSGISRDRGTPWRTTRLDSNPPTARQRRSIAV